MDAASWVERAHLRWATFAWIRSAFLFFKFFQIDNHKLTDIRRDDSVDSAGSCHSTETERTHLADRSDDFKGVARYGSTRSWAKLMPLDDTGYRIEFIYF